MANLLNGLLKDGSLHVLIQLFLSAILLIQERKDTSVLHFLLRSCTGWVFSYFLDNLKHSFQGMKHQLIGHVSKVDGCDRQHKNDPARTGQVNSCFELSLTFQTVGYTELDATVSCAQDCVLF